MSDAQYLLDPECPEVLHAARVVKERLAGQRRVTIARRRLQRELAQFAIGHVPTCSRCQSYDAAQRARAEADA